MTDEEVEAKIGAIESRRVDELAREQQHPMISVTSFDLIDTAIPWLIAELRRYREDAKRLDWFDTRCEAIADATGTEHIANAWGIYAQTSNIRDAIDSEMLAPLSPTGVQE